MYLHYSRPCDPTKQHHRYLAALQASVVSLQAKLYRSIDCYGLEHPRSQQLSNRLAIIKKEASITEHRLVQAAYLV